MRDHFPGGGGGPAVSLPGCAVKSVAQDTERVTKKGHEAVHANQGVRIREDEGSHSYISTFVGGGST